jgi:NAD(P)-dependent dehydrogenase (short-subunit alcohol dehydrogenase family)
MASRIVAHRAWADDASAYAAALTGAIMTTLAGKTLFISGASRGIGLAIALRAARDGANIAIAAKTSTPHPKLPGTIHTAADEVRRAGGQAFRTADRSGGSQDDRGIWRRRCLRQ